MTHSRIISFSRGGQPGYGLLVEGGVIDASARRRARWPTLREVIADNALPSLIQMAGELTPDLAVEEIVFEIPIPLPEKILCVGVNYPDRNEEYKDGQAAASNPSLFVRFPRSFTGHDQPLIRPRKAHSSTMKARSSLS